MLGGTVVYPLSEHWDQIVQLYTGANLTRADDKLVAISGLARETLKEVKDSYYAGLWGSDFATNLLWYLPFQQRRPPIAYRAPSWSWASVDGRVEFLVKRPTPDNPTTSTSSIRTVRTTGIDGKQSSTGQIEDGFCRILGPLRTGTRYERHGSSHRLIMSDALSAYHSYVDSFRIVLSRLHRRIWRACLCYTIMTPLLTMRTK